MEITKPIRSTFGVSFAYRGSLISALLFGVALLARTAIFVSDVHVRHSACVVGWPFLGDMFMRSLVGTVVGVPLSAKAMSLAERTNSGLLYARAALYFNAHSVFLGRYIAAFPGVRLSVLLWGHYGL